MSDLGSKSLDRVRRSAAGYEPPSGQTWREVVRSKCEEAGIEFQHQAGGDDADD